MLSLKMIPESKKSVVFHGSPFLAPSILTLSMSVGGQYFGQAPAAEFRLLSGLDQVWRRTRCAQSSTRLSTACILKPASRIRTSLLAQAVKLCQAASA